MLRLMAVPLPGLPESIAEALAFPSPAETATVAAILHVLGAGSTAEER
jgi:hypothetical protein